MGTFSVEGWDGPEGSSEQVKEVAGKAANLPTKIVSGYKTRRLFIDQSR